MTKNEIRKTTITLTTEEQTILSSASDIITQLINIIDTDKIEYTLYCELEEGYDIEYSINELDKMVGALYTIATNPLEIA